MFVITRTMRENKGRSLPKQELKSATRVHIETQPTFRGVP